MITNNEAEIERIKAKLAKFEEEHSYIIGFNDGWDENVEQSKDEIKLTVRILAGTGISSLPNDYPLSKLAEDVRNDARNKALEEAAKMIEYGVERGIEGRGQCIHSKYKWEDCDPCCASAIRALKR